MKLVKWDDDSQLQFFSSEATIREQQSREKFGKPLEQVVDGCTLDLPETGAWLKALKASSRQRRVEIGAIARAMNTSAPRIFDANFRKGRQSDDSDGGHQSLTQT
jgi:hypothetical protein